MKLKKEQKEKYRKEVENLEIQFKDIKNMIYKSEYFSEEMIEIQYKKYLQFIHIMNELFENVISDICENSEGIK